MLILCMQYKHFWGGGAQNLGKPAYIILARSLTNTCKQLPSLIVVNNNSYIYLWMKIKIPDTDAIYHLPLPDALYRCQIPTTDTRWQLQMPNTNCRCQVPTTDARWKLQMPNTNYRCQIPTADVIYSVIICNRVKSFC